MENILDLYNTREGTSQRTRLDPNLLPENFKIDGRTSVDLVRFAIEFSKSLNYYHADGSVTHNWKDFFVKDRIVYLYIIANTNLDQIQKSFYQDFEFIQNLTDPNDIASHLSLITRPLHELLDLLASWYSNLELSTLENEDMLNIPKYVRKEGVAEGIRRAHVISLKYLSETQWDSIGLNFSIDLDSNLDYEYDEMDLGLIKNTFEKVFLLARQIIGNADETISGRREVGHTVRPHIALFLGFLKTYSLLQDRLNGITREHLDFYYQEVLKISRQTRTPDEAFVRFVLARDNASHYLQEGTELIGGKDSKGMPVVYQTIHGTWLTGSKIAGLRTYFVSQNRLNYTGLGERKVVSDIFFKEHDPDNIGEMKAFGEDQFFRAASERTMQTARVGFIVASDHLFLSEGERTIYLDIEATSESYESFKGLIKDIDQHERANISNEDYTFFQIFNTALDLFLVLDGSERKYERFKVVDHPEIKGITVEINVPADEPPVDSLKSANPVNQQLTGSPYIKVLLREESHIYAFPLIRELDVVNIRLRVSVKGMKNFILYNNYGQVDHSKPFQPFGAVPKVNSYFMLGNREIFSKSIKKIDALLDWYQLPSDPDGWSGYFAGYDETVLNSDYKVEVTCLHSGTWKKIRPGSELFLFEEEVLDQDRLKKLSGRTLLQGIGLPVDPAETRDGAHFQPYNPKTRSGYLKFELVAPDFGFGFNAYNKNLFKSISHNARLVDSGPVKAPNPPLSPVLKSIALDYYAETEMISEKGALDSIQLICIDPAGYIRRELKSSEKPVGLLLDYQPEGHLMIGLDRYPDDGLISFYFDTRASDMEFDLHDIPVPRWQYLTRDHWEDMPSNALRFDNTNGLLQSGIISMIIPPDISGENTLTGDNLYWIKASVARNSHVVPNVVGIYTNVARVKWNGKSDGSHLGKQHDDNRITKLKASDPKISGVQQVSGFFHGKGEEEVSDYYVRVSERLRHKNRACTNWDYERLVLEKFPFVFKVKSFHAFATPAGHKGSDKYVRPGNVLLVVTPDVTNPGITDKLRPKFGINVLARIRNYLKGLSSPFIDIDVRNPYYESIQVICKVKFKSGLNAGHYISRLNQDLIDYITPWISSPVDDEQFGNSHYRSKIMAYVDHLEYIDFVTSFSVIKINDGQEKLTLFDTANTRKSNEIITPEYPWSILTSVRQHNITVIQDSKYRPPEPRGIDNMILGVDFILNE